MTHSSYWNSEQINVQNRQLAMDERKRRTVDIEAMEEQKYWQAVERDNKRTERSAHVKFRYKRYLPNII